MRRPTTPWSGKLMGSFKAAHCSSWWGKDIKPRQFSKHLYTDGQMFPQGKHGLSLLGRWAQWAHSWKSRKNLGWGHQQAEIWNKGLHGQQTRTRDTGLGAERSRVGYLWKLAARASRARCCWHHRQSLLHAWKAAGRALCWKWQSALACNSWGENREWPFVLYIKNEKSLSRSHSQGRTASDTNTF